MILTRFGIFDLDTTHTGEIISESFNSTCTAVFMKDDCSVDQSAFNSLMVPLESHRLLADESLVVVMALVFSTMEVV